MSFEQFLSMNGYGSYVWGSFGVCFALMALEVLLLRQRMRLAAGLLAGQSEEAACAAAAEEVAATFGQGLSRGVR